MGIGEGGEGVGGGMMKGDALIFIIAAPPASDIWAILTRTLRQAQVRWRRRRDTAWWCRMLAARRGASSRQCTIKYSRVCRFWQTFCRGDLRSDRIDGPGLSVDQPPQPAERSALRGRGPAARGCRQ